ncbi:cytidine deaminase-like protein [Mycena floridula]|nr:cytidine deaminase-like protein [Mycena floridula]
MFIAIIGTRCSGKRTIHDFLVDCKDFTPVQLFSGHKSTAEDLARQSSELETFESYSSAFTQPPKIDVASKHMSFLSLENEATPLSSPAPFKSQSLTFSTPEELLVFITKNWKTNFVTLDLHTRDLVQVFIKRPYFMLLSVDGPLLERYRRSTRFSTLEEFVFADDQIVFNSPSSLEAMRDLVDIRIINDFRNIPSFHERLEETNLLDPLHLRPDWDGYFMTLASLASRRSNCMKRRVGAILVRENRIVATGYNGTPRSVTNCNEGGCAICNATASLQDGEECVCLHAEENALLEAGRERVGAGAVLYCNTCPCLKCTIKIIQTGVKEVVYNLAYKVDAASSRLFSEAGVQLRRFDPKARHYLPNAVAQDELGV